MKKYKLITIFIYIAILLLPLVTFNFEEGAISESENRVLADNPFKNGINGESITNFKHYFDDRIGFRDEMIDAYTNINDKLFDKLVHPFYTKGKDGHIFASGMSVDIEYNEYHEAFANMVYQIQNYCNQNGIDFLFVFSPAKPAVYQEYILDSVHYDRTWVDTFLNKIDELGINYLDLTKTLNDKKNEGIDVFNKKFDANHWNSVGAFYGINAILDKLSESNNVKANSLEDYDEVHSIAEKLLLSSYRIDEEIISLDPKYSDITDKTDLYQDGLRIHYNYNDFGSFINNRIDIPFKLLSFQGSYLNTYGKAHLKNGVQDYTYVHNYHNVLHLPYYAQIFKPDAIIFEVAEYTLKEDYFNYEEMLELSFNPDLNDTLNKSSKITHHSLDELDIVKTNYQEITELVINNIDYDHAWIRLNDVTYDFDFFDGLHLVGILNDDYSDNYTIYIENDNQINIYD